MSATRLLCYIYYDSRAPQVQFLFNFIVNPNVDVGKYLGDDIKQLSYFEQSFILRSKLCFCDWL